MDADRIQLQAEPLEVGPAIEFVTAPAAGGIGVFLGTTREAARRWTRRAEPRRPAAGGAGLRGVCRDGRAADAGPGPAGRGSGGRSSGSPCCTASGGWRWGSRRSLIAVSTPHRAEAFDACRWLIDTLKAEVADLEERSLGRRVDDLGGRGAWEVGVGDGAGQGTMRRFRGKQFSDARVVPVFLRSVPHHRHMRRACGARNRQESQRPRRPHVSDVPASLRPAQQLQPPPHVIPVPAPCDHGDCRTRSGGVGEDADEAKLHPLAVVRPVDSEGAAGLARVEAAPGHLSQAQEGGGAEARVIAGAR